MTGYNPRKLNFKYIIPERFHFLWPAMRKILPHRGRRREQMIIHINDKLSLTKVNYPFLYLMAGLRFNLWLRGGGIVRYFAMHTLIRIAYLHLDTRYLICQTWAPKGIVICGRSRNFNGGGGGVQRGGGPGAVEFVGSYPFTYTLCFCS